MLWTLDSFDPSLLRCRHCGHALPVSLDPWDDPASLRMLTEDEAIAYFPALSLDLRLHGMTCAGAWFGVPMEEWEGMAAPRR